MQIKADTPEHYINQPPDGGKRAVRQLLKTILDNLPKEFEERAMLTQIRNWK